MGQVRHGGDDHARCQICDTAILCPTGYCGSNVPREASFGRRVEPEAGHQSEDRCEVAKA